MNLFWVTGDWADMQHCRFRDGDPLCAVLTFLLCPRNHWPNSCDPRDSAADQCCTVSHELVIISLLKHALFFYKGSSCPPFLLHNKVMLSFERS